MDRHPGHPLEALQLLDETREWRGLVWEAEAPRVTPPPPPETEGEVDEALDEDDDDATHRGQIDDDSEPERGTCLTRSRVSSTLLCNLALDAGHRRRDP